MKTIIFGDTHGRPYWETILSYESFDKVIFIGDYFDAKNEISATHQIHNFKKIVDYKKIHTDKEVIMLIGNHDYHYWPGVAEHYSGYQEKYAYFITDELYKAKDSLQMCHVVGEWIFTHAGVTKTWANRFKIDYSVYKNVEQSINELFAFQPLSFGFDYIQEESEVYDDSGNSISQGPLWVRPASLIKDAIPGIHVVGHTRVNQIKAWDDRLWFIDAMSMHKEGGQYLKIKEDGVKVKNFIIA